MGSLRALVGRPHERSRRGAAPQGPARGELMALLARGMPGIVGQMTSGSSFASRISLSSANARCHCSPFSHALIPAL